MSVYCDHVYVFNMLLVLCYVMCTPICCIGVMYMGVCCVFRYCGCICVCMYVLLVYVCVCVVVRVSWLCVCWCDCVLSVC